MKDLLATRLKHLSERLKTAQLYYLVAHGDSANTLSRIKQGKLVCVPRYIRQRKFQKTMQLELLEVLNDIKQEVQGVGFVFTKEVQSEIIESIYQEVTAALLSYGYTGQVSPKNDQFEKLRRQANG